MAWEMRLLMPNNSGKVGILSVIPIRHAHLVTSFKLRIVQGSAVAEPCLLANERVGPPLVHGTNGEKALTEAFFGNRTTKSRLSTI